MWGLGIEHWVIVVGVALFGCKRLPLLMRDLGKTVKEVKNLPAVINGDDDGA